MKEQQGQPTALEKIADPRLRPAEHPSERPRTTRHGLPLCVAAEGARGPKFGRSAVSLTLNRVRLGMRRT